MIVPEENPTAEELREAFGDIDPNKIAKNSDEGSIDGAKIPGKKKVTGKDTYKEMAKDIAPECLTDEKIKELIWEKLPKLDKDSEEFKVLSSDEQTKANNKRNKDRSNFKKYLTDRMNDAHKSSLKEQVIVKETKSINLKTNGHVVKEDEDGVAAEVEPVNEDQRGKIIAGILDVQRYLDESERMTDEAMKDIDTTSLKEHFGKITNRAMDKFNSPGEVGYQALTWIAMIAEGMSPYTKTNYDVDFRGVLKAHEMKKEQLKLAVSGFLIENPDLQKYISGTNRFFLEIGSIYAYTAIQNKGYNPNRLNGQTNGVHAAN